MKMKFATGMGRKKKITEITELAQLANENGEEKRSLM
jgi:hypothetical protein